MIINTLFAYAQRRTAAYRRYRQTLAEIRAMSNEDLHEIGAFQIDLVENARREWRAA